MEAPQEFGRSRIAALVGITVLRIENELSALDFRDVTFGKAADRKDVGILTRKSKTGQEVGVFRSSNAAGESLRPYNQMGRWVDSKKNMSENSLVIGDGISPLVTKLIKWAVAEHHLPSDRFPIHSLRPGGATCLYHSGFGLEYIRRFGRWLSIACAIYLHCEDEILRKISSRLMKCE